jgi:hypothetical protein
MMRLDLYKARLAFFCPGGDLTSLGKSGVHSARAAKYSGKAERTKEDKEGDHYS